MDPLSIVASLIALTQAAEASGKGVGRLLALRNAPAVLDSVLNEITDFRALLTVVRSGLEKPTLEDGGEALDHLTTILERGNTVLRKIDLLVETHLTHRDDDGTFSRVRKRGFLKEKRLDAVRRELREVRHSLTSALVALHTLQLNVLPRLRLGVQHISTVTTTMTPLTTQISAPDLSETSLIHSMEMATAAGQLSCQGAQGPAQAHTQQRTSIVISACTLQETCSSYCSCQCHIRTTGSSPAWLNLLFGSLFYDFTSLPMLGHRPCNWSRCQRREKSRCIFKYRFPSWLAALAIMASVETTVSGVNARCFMWVPEFADLAQLIQVLVKSDDPCLLSRQMRLCKIPARAHCSSTGKPILHHAVAWGRIESVRMLLKNGADWDQHTASDISMSQVAWERILRLGKEDFFAIALRELLKDDVGIEIMQFNELHKIVNGLSGGDLQQQIEANPALVTKVDSCRNTPLEWAVRFNDAQAVTLLLDAIPDDRTRAQLATEAFPVMRSTRLMRVLIAAGADLHKPDRWGQTAFDNAVGRNDLDTARFLLDEGAYSELPLHFPALLDAACFGHNEMLGLLLQHSCRVNKSDKTRVKAMRFAIYADQIECVRLLHSRGVLFNSVSETLCVAAEGATIPMMKVLMELGVGHLPMESSDIARYWKIFDRRVYSYLIAVGVTEKEKDAFDELLQSVSPDSGGGSVDGFSRITPNDPGACETSIPEDSEDEIPSEQFEDALENPLISDGDRECRSPMIMT